MKNCQYLMVMIVFLGPGSLWAQGIFTMPKWVMEYNNAYYLYRAGVGETSTDPADAIQALQSAQKFDEYALQNGGNYYAVELSGAISRALVSAQSRVKDSKRKNIPLVAVHRMVVRPNNAVHTQPLRVNIVRN